jgi:hypothetical protein
VGQTKVNVFNSAEKSLSAMTSCKNIRKNYEFYHLKKSSYEPIVGCKHPIIASGVTPIRSAERSPDKENKR